MPIELIHAVEFPQCRIHYVKGEASRRGFFQRMEPTFEEARDLWLLSNKQLRNIWQSNDQFSNVIKHNKDPEQTEIVLPCARGDWIKAITVLIDNGFSMISILLSREQDESRSANRMCIPVPGYDVIFLPNYKCGYSSMRRYVAELTSDKSSRTIDADSIERKKIDLLKQGKQQRVVSIVRDPLQRYFSFYREKVMRPKNYPLYGKPAQRLYGKHDPLTMLNAIADIPDEFRDPHVKSQYGNLFFQDNSLVHKWYRIEEMSSELTSHLALPGEFPHIHRTKPVPEVENVTQELIDSLSTIYANDYQTFGYDLSVSPN